MISLYKLGKRGYCILLPLEAAVFHIGKDTIKEEKNKEKKVFS
jgi:hypothetical protein